MKKKILMILIIILLTGCSAVRIDTKNIDNIINVVLSKNNKLYNQIGQGYKYYLPKGVIYIDSDDLNDILYCNGTYYYLYVDTIKYYYKTDLKHIVKDNVYYYKKIDQSDGFKYSGYIEIEKKDDLYYLDFVYNYARIEAYVSEDELNNAVLNSSYILSTIKYNKDIVKLMLNEDYFTNKTSKYNQYNSKSKNEKFKLEKENTMEEDR